MSEKPTICSVGALVLNWQDDLRTVKCLESLLRDDCVSQVFLIDNESTPDKDWASKYPEVKWERISVTSVPENRGFAAGINIGLTQFLKSELSHILIINNDAVTTPGAVNLLLHASLNNSNPHQVAPLLVYPNGEIQSAGSTINWDTAAVNHESYPNIPDYASWACVLINKPTLELVGLLDETFFMYWEDADFGLRLRSLGGETIIVPEATVIHEESATKQRIGQKTTRLATASLGTFSVKYPQLERAARRRLFLRASRQTLRHGLQEGKRTLRAMAWGQKNKSTAWKSIHQQSWLS